MSITEMQVKESFSSPEQLNGFVSMIYNAIDKSMTVKTDALVMRTINNMIAETVYSEYGAANINSKSTVKAINLLYLYNQEYSKSLTAAKALKDPDFIRYAAYIIGMTASRLGTISTLFNIGGKDRFTPSDLLHIVMLADFKKKARMCSCSPPHLMRNIPNCRTPKSFPTGRGSGTGYDFTGYG